MREICVLDCLEMNGEHIDRAYQDVFELMRDIGMQNEAEQIIPLLSERLRDDNPFGFEWNKNDRYCLTPTDHVISSIYLIASREISRKFPSVKVKWHADGYYSKFEIDDETYAKGNEEYLMEEVAE